MKEVKWSWLFLFTQDLYTATKALCFRFFVLVMYMMGLYGAVSNGHPFLSLTGNLAFQLNIDWFNPFKHTQHWLSIWAFWTYPELNGTCKRTLSLLELGPKEPPLHLNTFLEPLVNDLRTGVLMKSDTLLCQSSFALCHMRHSCSKKSLRVYGTCRMSFVLPKGWLF